ncbi:MAG: 2-succinyl-5-enolpyruvyl-6-hydroxy-3-cyclohexene-1-carboxylic-acid synthase [bacterium]
MSADPKPDEAQAAANAAAAAQLAAGLADAGVRAAVISPGSRNTPLVLALAARPDIAAHSVVDERVAGFLALGLARASGRPVVLSCTSGSAGAHYLPALIEAWHSRVPLVVVTADRPAELHGCGAPQTIDQRHLFGGFVHLSRDLPAPAPGLPDAWIRAAAADATRRARRRGGPVHLNAAFREPLWMPGLAVEAPAARPEAAEAPFTAPPLAALADRVTAARRGVIVAGPGAPPLAPLAEALGWPLLAEAAAGPNPGRITTADALLRGPFARHRPDLALRFGLPPTAKSLNRWLHGVDTITVDPHGDRLDPTHAAAVVEADPAALAAALAALPTAPDADWRPRWRRAEAIARATLDRHLRDGLWGGAIAAALTAARPAAIHAGNSMAIRDLDLADPGPARVYSSRGANGIDGTIATAAGEALATAGPLAALLGDLSALHDAGGLLHAGALDRPLTLVVADNGGGGIFEYLPIAAHAAAFERWFLTPRSTRLDALCAAAGVRYAEVTAAPALAPALAAAINRPGVDCVHVRVDRQDDTARHRAAWAAVAAATEDL